MKSNLKKIREDAGLTLRGLSDITGITYPYLHTLESSNANPTLRRAYIISTVLGADIESIWPNEIEFEEVTIVTRRVKQ